METLEQGSEILRWFSIQKIFDVGVFELFKGVLPKRFLSSTPHPQLFSIFKHLE